MNASTGSEQTKDMKLPAYLKIASILVALLAGVYILFVLRETLIPLAFSVLFAILLHPLCLRFERWRIPRVLAILISLLIFIVVLAGLIYLASIQIAGFADEIPRITQKAESLLEQLLTMGERYFNVSRTQQVTEGKRYFLNALGESRTMLLNTIVSTTGTLTTAILVPLYVFFFLLYRDFFRRFLHKAFKRVPDNRLDQILQKIYVVIRSYLAGLVLVIGIVGILNTIGLLLLGIDNAIFFGFLAAFLILIPYVGILIGSILPALMSIVTEDSPIYALGVIGVMAFVQFLEGNFITPNIVGSKVSINPLAAIVALFLGGQLWGLSGLILALPLTAITKVILDSNPSLEPYGYLLGEPEQEVAEEKAKEVGRPDREEPPKRRRPPRHRNRNKPASNQPEGTTPGTPRPPRAPRPSPPGPKSSEDQGS
ncbi:AI-2E family transporter [Telluribacter sp.]|jgi:predicted PurR-regulated permease PerM|uniref:AI-2E family transporter n=1 Tax=Telluribacter sp. TaxID=1978767 RepID=UPI002E0E0D21|nr:AI-2E family transporter [Telluribacter sp.]